MVQQDVVNKIISELKRLRPDEIKALEAYIGDLNESLQFVINGLMQIGAFKKIKEFSQKLNARHQIEQWLKSKNKEVRLN